jgi:hypothetical protein
MSFKPKYLAWHAPLQHPQPVLLHIRL